MTDRGQRFRFIGQPMPLREDTRFVRGRGRYINDLEIPGMLHLGVASAPVAHARLLSVDTSAAEQYPGVVAVITGAQITEWMNVIPQEFHKLPEVHWYPLAVDKIRLVGEWVAAVVATSRAVAEDAAALVTYEYEELEPVIDMEYALDPAAPVLHEGHGSNVAWAGTWTWGEVDAAFAAAEVVREYNFRWHRHSGVPIETFGVVTQPHPDGSLDVWASHQNPNIQQEMMDVLRLPTVRVNMDVDVGGSYGSKRGKKQMYLTSVAALVTGRPVKFIEDRIENMQAGDGHGPDRIYRARVAASGDGIVSALDIDVIEDLGAYGGRGGINKPTTAPTGCYRINHVRYGGHVVLTCKTNQVPFRGNGQSPHNFVLERIMDNLARELGLDPVDIRMRNYIRKDEFPWRTPSGSVYDTGDYHAAMNLLLERGDLESLRKRQQAARAEGRLVGIGIAGCVEPSGGGRDPNVEAARIQIDAAGRVIVSIGFQSSGQSHETMVTQVVCEELGVAPADVIIVRASGKGSLIGGATTASRMTLMLGTALRRTTDKLKDKLREIAAHLLEAAPADIEVDGDSYRIAGDPDKSLPLKDLARTAYRAVANLPPDMEPGLVADTAYPGPKRPKGTIEAFPSYAFDFHLAMVEIDPDTFEIAFQRYLVVHDCGTVINPLVVDGFVYGGLAHGIGGALYENFSYDPSGVLQSATFMDYLLPTCAEVPEAELVTMQTPTPMHPYGAKGTAEGSYMTAPATVASAVEDALAPLGIRIDELPITPALLFERYQQARGEREG
jgi:CO/xanthine dehydrogenase Mo-binding subunit